MPATVLCDDTKQDGCDGEDEINCRKLPDFITCIVLYFPLPRAKKNKSKSITNKQQQLIIMLKNVLAESCERLVLVNETKTDLDKGNYQLQ